MRIITLFFACLHTLSLLTTTTLAAPAPQLFAITPHAQDLAKLSTSWMDERYDPVYKLLRTASKNFLNTVGTHTTRETLWYSIGLFLRNNGSDHDCAIRAVRMSSTTSLTRPTTRSTARSVAYQRYDPIGGTTLAIILPDFESMLPPDLVARIEHALRLAAEGDESQKLRRPYDRSHGIDMTRYQSLIVQWIWLAVGHDQAPVPDLTRPFNHPDDWCFVPMVALLSPYARIPPTVLPRLQSFTSGCTISRVVASTAQRATNHWQDDPWNRIVTSWLSENVMIEAQICNETGSQLPVPPSHPPLAPPHRRDWMVQDVFYG
ncbi:hypothetical protein BC938DRAFT_474599 [Jimgerdemannia flammicorona]|uniref:Uncharacterized protein n=1 Tax=Jimgerdemannia flammicorona TaxID=994334 RepID=A0A433Q1W5_9FUNG|nr:hypothetical protein BC938DRAFT_474599 [Jimgerdemannia flammicorona]